MLIGTWLIDSTTVFEGETNSILNNFNVTFTKGENENIVNAAAEDINFFGILNFHNKGYFELHNSESNEKIAEFEFFHPLFPHITASGNWKNNSIYVAELVSFTSMSLSIFNKEDKSTTVYTFSKDIYRGEQSFFEKNFPMIATIAVVALHFLSSEYKKRQAAIKIKQQTEEEMKKLNKELKENNEEEEN